MRKFCDMCGFAPATERVERKGVMYNVCMECEALSEGEEDESE